MVFADIATIVFFPKELGYLPTLATFVCFLSEATAYP